MDWKSTETRLRMPIIIKGYPCVPFIAYYFKSVSYSPSKAI